MRRAEFEMEKAQEMLRYDQGLVDEIVGKWDGDEVEGKWDIGSAQVMDNDGNATASLPDAGGVLDILAQGFRQTDGERRKTK